MIPIFKRQLRKKKKHKKKDEGFTKLITMHIKKMSDPSKLHDMTSETMSALITPGKNDSDYTESHMPNLGGIMDGSGQANAYENMNGGFF